MQFFGFMVAAAGLLMVVRQMTFAARQRQIEAIADLYRRCFTDADVLDIYYEIEYDTFEYDANFPRSDKEKKLDKLLFLYNNIAKLYLLNNYRLEDLEIIAYNYLVVFQNENVKGYLNWLDGQWLEQRGIQAKPFDAFRTVGKIIEERWYQRV